MDLTTFLSAYQAAAEQHDMTIREDEYGKAIRADNGQCPIELAFSHLMGGTGRGFWAAIPIVGQGVKSLILDSADSQGLRQSRTVREFDLEHANGYDITLYQRSVWRAVLLKLSGLWPYQGIATYTPRMD